MKTIKFNKSATFQGRNGQFIQAGITIVQGDPILLIPVTSKWAFGNSHLSIPKEQVNEFVEALLSTSRE
jgi:hypothetical protein